MQYSSAEARAGTIKKTNRATLRAIALWGHAKIRIRGHEDTAQKIRIYKEREDHVSEKLGENLGDHPKAATYDHLKTGHSEGLRHTH